MHAGTLSEQICNGNGDRDGAAGRSRVLISPGKLLSGTRPRPLRNALNGRLHDRLHADVSTSRLHPPTHHSAQSHVVGVPCYLSGQCLPESARGRPTILHHAAGDSHAPRTLSLVLCNIATASTSTSASALCLNTSLPPAQAGRGSTSAACPCAL